MEIESTVAAILDAVRSLLLRPEPGDVAFDGERRELIARWPTPSPVAERSEPHRLPVCRFIDDALSAAARGPAHDLAAAMAPLLPALRWSYGYPLRPNEPGLASRIGFAQIIGPRGLMDHHQIHMGLTLMAPETHYPMHAHPAIETYLVVSGTADWRVGSARDGLSEACIAWRTVNVSISRRSPALRRIAITADSIEVRDNREGVPGLNRSEGVGCRVDQRSRRARRIDDTS